MTDRKQFGRHYLVDFSRCDPDSIKFLAATRESLLRAVDDCGATLVDHLFHQYEPFGVSGVVLIAESHLSVHTWPEDCFVAVDFFTCGDTDADAAIETMRRAFGAQEVTVKVVVRGQLERQLERTT